MASQRDKAKILVTKYMTDIITLEEREEDLSRQIQIQEKLTPLVLVVYLWKVSQSKKRCLDDEAPNKIAHLQAILAELEETDRVIKVEENLMRLRKANLESSQSENLNIHQIDSVNIIDTIGGIDLSHCEKDCKDMISKLKFSLDNTKQKLKENEIYIQQLKIKLPTEDDELEGKKGKPVKEASEEEGPHTPKVNKY